MAEEVNLLAKSQDLNYQHDVLKAFAETQRKKVESQQSIEGQTAEPKPTEESSKPLAEVAPKEPEKVEEPIKEVKTPEIEASTSWDADEIKETKTESPKFDFSKLGSALELGEIKDENEFVTKVSELKSKLKQVEEAPLQGIPDEFKEVLEITKKTGDWKSYLAESITDYSKVNPLDLYEDRVFQNAAKLPQFRNPDGTVNEKAIYDAIDAIPEFQRLSEGMAIQQQLAANQTARKAQIVAQARERSELAEKSLSKATKSLNEILPFENYGIKFEAKHSNSLFEGITNSKLTKKHLGLSYDDLVRSGANMTDVARTITMAEHGENMLKFKSSNSKVEAKKELLSKVQNVQLQTPGTAPDPESKEKQVTPIDKYKALLTGQLPGSKKGL